MCICGCWSRLIIYYIYFFYKDYLCFYRLQVNEKFYKLERVYRDCIKMTRDKTRIYSILHDAPGA